MPVVDASLLHCAVDVGFHCPNRQDEMVGDLLAGEPARGKGGDLSLAAGQLYCYALEPIDDR